MLTKEEEGGEGEGGERQDKGALWARTQQQGKVVFPLRRPGQNLTRDVGKHSPASFTVTSPLHALVPLSTESSLSRISKKWANKRVNERDNSQQNRYDLRQCKE